MREEIRVRGRVRPGRPPDRRLVDVDHLVEALDPVHAEMVAGLRARPVEPVRERLEDDLVHERRLARAGDTRHAHELPDRERDVDPLQVVHGRAAHREPAAVVLAPGRNGDAPLAGEELPRHRARCPLDLVGRPFRDDMAAVLARTRPHVHEPVGAPHHLLVVLDHDHRVAEGPQPLERGDQPVVVALVQTDRRLVEDVEHPDELRADLGREPKPLRLAARERLRRPVELEVADPDVGEERQPLADLLDDPMSDQLLRAGQIEMIEERKRPRHRLLREVVDRLAADLDGQDRRLEPRATALGTGPEAHVLLDPLALLLRVGLLVAPLERVDDAVERHRVLALPAHPVLVVHEDPVAARAEEEVVLLLRPSDPATVCPCRSRSGRRWPGRLPRRSSSCRPTTARARPGTASATYPERRGRGRSRAGSRAPCSAGTPRAAS